MAKTEQEKKRERLMLALIGVLVLIFIIMDPYNFIGKKSEVTETQEETQAITVQTANIPSTLGIPDTRKEIRQTSNDSIEREKTSFEGWVRDPFVQGRPDLDEQTLIETLKLGVISVQGNDRMALINSKPVRAGDEILGMVVSRIGVDYVILSSGHGRDYTLTWEK